MNIEKVDILENRILKMDKHLLEILLSDYTSQKNILWCTDNYKIHGAGYRYLDEIKLELITEKNGNIIKPRVKKSKNEQKIRIKDKAEVYTPAWVCNNQNNQIDSFWFSQENQFNLETQKGWKVNYGKINFSATDKTWKDYVNDKRLEISCGEAPYIVSRYDSVTGEILETTSRIGILDRKIRVINENVEDDEWMLWVKKAYQSVYGYEWQGDSLLIARENLLYTFIDYYIHRHGELPSIELQKEIATIISWNFWQMDGLKGVIPLSCDNKKVIQVDLFGEEVTQKCQGCSDGIIAKHNGVYCLINEWSEDSNISRYVDLFEKEVL
jgi:hypothetical protein